MTTKLLELEQPRRDAILNAALKEFALKGYDQASTNVIAKEGGISKALMFHYVNNKHDLFLCMCEYFTELLDKEYYSKLDVTEKDIFIKLRQSYLLQIKLLKQYPWIFEFGKLTISKDSCYPQIFDEIDISKFRSGLDIEKCKQFIFWSNVGFTNEILADIRDSKLTDSDHDQIIRKLDGYLDELRNIFYKSIMGEG